MNRGPLSARTLAERAMIDALREILGLAPLYAPDTSSSAFVEHPDPLTLTRTPLRGSK